MSLSNSISISLVSRLNGSRTFSFPSAVDSVVVFGNSIAAGQNASVAANRWINLVATALGAGTPLNQGIAGTVLQNSADSGGSARSNNGRDRYVTALLGTNKRDMVFIAYGFNDARYTGAPSTFNVANYENDLREVVAGLINGGYAQSEICILSPYYITDTGLATGSAGFTGQTRSGFEEFVTASASVAEDYGVYYVDIYAYMLANGAGTLIDTDNIHPNDTGHAVIKDGVLTATRRAKALTDYSSQGFLYDTFTDDNGAALNNHSGERNAVWVTQSGYTTTTQAKIGSNRLWPADAVGNVYRALAVPPSADYSVEANLDWLSSLAGDSVAIMGRAAEAANTYYWFGYSRTAGGWRLFKTVAGVNTQLGSTVSTTFTSGSRKIRLAMAGTTIRGYVDDVLTIDQTDSAIPDAGFAGIRFGVAGSASTGIHIADIRAY